MNKVCNWFKREVRLISANRFVAALLAVAALMFELTRNILADFCMVFGLAFALTMRYGGPN